MQPEVTLHSIASICVRLAARRDRTHDLAGTQHDRAQYRCDVRAPLHMHSET